jgi:hypothetical protein
VLFFLHVPKAGGTTFHEIIARQFPAGAIYNLDPNSPDEAVAAFKQLPLEQRRAFRLVKGHMPFGLHEYAGQPGTYFTMLRHPVERFVSLYYYVLASPTHYLHDRVAGKNMSLADFASSRLSGELDNGQTRLLAASHAQHLAVPFGELSTGALDAARAHLDEHFTLVGLAEQFDLTLLLLRARYGWTYRSLFYLRRNETPGRQPMGHVAPEAIQAIREHHQFDQALYDYVDQRLQEQTRRLLKAPDKQLATFRAWNSLYRRAAPVWARARDALPPRARVRLNRWMKPDAR